MLNNIFDNIIRILRGKNGGLFLIIGVVVLVMFINKIFGPLLWLLLIGGGLVWIFNNFEKKS